MSPNLARITIRVLCRAKRVDVVTLRPSNHEVGNIMYPDGCLVCAGSQETIVLRWACAVAQTIDTHGKFRKTCDLTRDARHSCNSTKFPKLPSQQSTLAKLRPAHVAAKSVLLDIDAIHREPIPQGRPVLSLCALDRANRGGHDMESAILLAPGIQLAGYVVGTATLAWNEHIMPLVAIHPSVNEMSPLTECVYMTTTARIRRCFGGPRASIFLAGVFSHMDSLRIEGSLHELVLEHSTVEYKLDVCKLLT